MVDNNHFANNLKYLRLTHGIEQLELANLLGRKSASSISEWEKGKYTPKAGTLNDLAKIFNIPLSKLMNDDLENPTGEIIENAKKTTIDLANLISDKKPSSWDDPNIDWDEWVSFNGKPISDDVKKMLFAIYGDRLID